MSTISSPSPDPSHSAAARRKSAIAVASCTVLGAAAQILFKIGMGPNHFVPTAMGIATNVPLIAGFAFYGVFTLVMVLALRQGELSML